MRELLEQFFRHYLRERNLEDTLALLTDQVISLGTGEQEVARIRKSHENADNSGNYVGYPEIKNEKIGGLDVSLKEKDGKVVLAIWSDGAYSYSISLDEQSVSLEEMTALVEAVK